MIIIIKSTNSIGTQRVNPRSLRRHSPASADSVRNSIVVVVGYRLVCKANTISSSNMSQRTISMCFAPKVVDSQRGKPNGNRRDSGKMYIILK